ncbi:hypothetical protein CC86DRAFT_400793 [Ophiobolus disseminans]|uniref:Uncharacterized protein n=1 Tax=Ophiobolus disseminans TaxID=1469910 RepID=A0A6A7AFB8_9PLEO|nr:hypothetical protein CC86DRAFT_400793 [Ophiobolus disseminans]
MPQEMRDVVYNALWKVTPKIEFTGSKNSSDTFELLYNPPQDPTASNTEPLKGLPTWLLANKAFLHEGLKQLHLRASYEQHAAHLLHDAAHLDTRDRLVGLHLAKTISIITQFHKRRKSSSIKSVDAKELEALGPVLAPKLMKLDLHVDCDEKYSQKSYPMDLSFFDHSDLRLESLSVNVRLFWPCFHEGSKIDPEVYDKAFGVFKDEARRLGRVLVGSGAVFEFDGKVEGGNEMAVFVREGE